MSNLGYTGSYSDAIEDRIKELVAERERLRTDKAELVAALKSLRNPPKGATMDDFWTRLDATFTLIAKYEDKP